MIIQGLHHIGIVVRDVERAITQYGQHLNLQTTHREDYGGGLLTIAFIPLGPTDGRNGPLIELLQPLRPGSSAWTFLQEKGEGIEHIAMSVSHLDDQLQQLQNQRVPLWDHVGRDGADGTRIAFLDPEGFSGCLLELVESHGE